MLINITPSEVLATMVGVVHGGWSWSQWLPSDHHLFAKEMLLHCNCFYECWKIYLIKPNTAQFLSLTIVLLGHYQLVEWFFYMKRIFKLTSVIFCKSYRISLSDSAAVVLFALSCHRLYLHGMERDTCLHGLRHGMTLLMYPAHEGMCVYYLEVLESY